MNNNKSEIFLRIRQISVISTIPFVLAGGPLIGYFLSSWIERTFGGGIWMRLIVILLLTAASINEAVRLIRRVIKDR